jgi:heptosyltransferase I
MPRPLPENPSNILVIKPSAIGDIVHALPFLNLLRKCWPAAKITWLATPICAGLVENHPQIDEVIRFDRRRFGKSWRKPAALIDLAQFWLSLRRRKFDLVIDLQCLLRSGWMAWIAGAPVRIGLSTAREGARYAYTHIVPDDFNWQAVERYLGVAKFLGCGGEPIEYVFAVNDEDREMVASLVGNLPYAVLIPGANWLTKRWPPEHFNQTAAALRERFGLGSFVAGAAGDRALAEQIPNATDLTGKTNLPQTVALLEKASLVIGNDTGPMHIAAALGRPLVTVYGPTDPQMTGPHHRLASVIKLDIACSPCHGTTCWHNSCMRLLGAEAMMEAAARQLNGTAIPNGDGKPTIVALPKGFSPPIGRNAPRA